MGSRVWNKTKIIPSAIFYLTQFSFFYQPNIFLAWRVIGAPLPSFKNAHPTLMQSNRLCSLRQSNSPTNGAMSPVNGDIFGVKTPKHQRMVKKFWANNRCQMPQDIDSTDGPLFIDMLRLVWSVVCARILV